MTQISSNRSLFEVLKEKDSALAAQVEKIKEIGLKDWVGFLAQDKGSHTGYPHLLNVERLADRIVPDHIKEHFLEGELFLLLSSIFLHDIGKITDFPKQATNDNKENTSSDNAGEEDRSAEDFSEAPHYVKSEYYIKHNGIRLGLPDDRIAQYCGLIAFCHGLDRPPNWEKTTDTTSTKDVETRENFRTTSLTPYGLLRIPLLAAILRLADETDNSWQRAVGKHWQKYLAENTEGLGKAFRGLIEDVDFSHAGECLIIHVPTLDEANAGIDKSISLEDSIKYVGIARDKISQVLSGGWGEILEASIGVRFRAVFIEYNNHLYTDLNNYQSLGQVLSEAHNNRSDSDKEQTDPDKKRLEDLFNAAIRLSLGSFRHRCFSWQSLEAQVGKPLTDFDKWLTLRMGNITPKFQITGSLESEKIEIILDNPKNVDDIKIAVIG